MKASQYDLTALRKVLSPLAANEAQRVQLVIEHLDGTAHAIFRNVSTLDEFSHEEIFEAVTRLEPLMLERKRELKARASRRLAAS